MKQSKKYLLSYSDRREMKRVAEWIRKEAEHLDYTGAHEEGNAISNDAETLRGIANRRVRT